MSIRNNRRRIWAIAGLAAGLVASCNVVSAQIPCSYEVQIIASSNGCGGFGTVNTFGLGVNEHGDVVGYYKCPLWNHSEAFLWTADGGFVTLQRPQGVSSAIAVDINDNGVICGTVNVSGVGQRGFVYQKGEWTILPPVVDVPGPWSGAAAINNEGVVVGNRSLTDELNPRNAYFWSAKRGFTDLGVMSGPSSFGSSISETGIVAGWAGNPSGSVADAFIWQDRKLTLLGHVRGGFTSQATAVTNDGVVVGRGRIELKGFPVGAPRGFSWEDGSYEMVGTLPNHDWSSSSDIQAISNVVVGISWNVDGSPTIAHGFIWQDGVIRNLNDFIPPESAVLVESAAKITVTGQIVANGDDEAGEIVAFILTPAEEPLGDLSGDCQIGAIDLLILLAAWGDRDSPADLNGDGIVGAADLLILLVNWGSE